MRFVKQTILFCMFGILSACSGGPQQSGWLVKEKSERTSLTLAEKKAPYFISAKEVQDKVLLQKRLADLAARYRHQGTGDVHISIFAASQERATLYQKNIEQGLARTDLGAEEVVIDPLVLFSAQTGGVVVTYKTITLQAPDCPEQELGTLSYGCLTDQQISKMVRHPSDLAGRVHSVPADTNMGTQAIGRYEARDYSGPPSLLDDITVAE